MHADCIVGGDPNSRLGYGPADRLVNAGFFYGKVRASAPASAPTSAPPCARLCTRHCTRRCTRHCTCRCSQLCTHLCTHCTPSRPLQVRAWGSDESRVSGGARTACPAGKLDACTNPKPNPNPE